MRRWRWAASALALLLLLSACSKWEQGGSGAEELALASRTEYIAMTGCTAQMALTADYGQRVYEYGISVSWAREGETVLTLTAPEELAGVTARVGPGGSFLDFDGARVETGTLGSGSLTPMGAVPSLLEYAAGGFIAECGLETMGQRETLHITCREPEATPGTGVEAQLWFDVESHALLRGEISSDGFTVIQCTFTDFAMTLPPAQEETPAQ